MARFRDRAAQPLSHEGNGNTNTLPAVGNVNGFVVV